MTLVTRVNRARQPSLPAMQPHSIKKGLFLCLGLLFAGLGFVGIFLPLLPTTVFWIVAVDMFVRSNPALAAPLLNHPRFGPGLRAWFERGAIGRAAKIAASGGISVSMAILIWTFWPRFVLLSAIALGLAAVLTFIWSRPSR